MPKICTSLIIIALATVQLSVANTAYAATCERLVRCPEGAKCPTQSFAFLTTSDGKSSCDVAQQTIYKGTNNQKQDVYFTIKSCTTCIDGYTSSPQTYTDQQTGCVVQYYICSRCPNTPCQNCEPDAVFKSAGTGQETKTTRACKCGECVTTKTEYRCAAGYYGDGKTCTQCPPTGTSNAGSTKIQDCYATTFRDSKGSGRYSANCYAK